MNKLIRKFKCKLNEISDKLSIYNRFIENDEISNLFVEEMEYDKLVEEVKERYFYITIVFKEKALNYL